MNLNVMLVFRHILPLIYHEKGSAANGLIFFQKFEPILALPLRKKKERSIIFENFECYEPQIYVSSRVKFF